MKKMLQEYATETAGFIFYLTLSLYSTEIIQDYISKNSIQKTFSIKTYQKFEHTLNH
jgi:hypothetical protein